MAKAVKRLREAVNVEKYPVGTKVMYKSFAYPHFVPATVVEIKTSLYGYKTYFVTCDNDPYGETVEVFSHSNNMRLPSADDEVLPGRSIFRF